MSHFVKHHKQHISSHEFCEPLMMLRSMILKPRMIAKRQCGGVDSGLKLLHVSCSRLRENRPGDAHKDERQEKQCASPREKLQCHRSPVVTKLLVEKPACTCRLLCNGASRDDFTHERGRDHRGQYAHLI